MKKVLAVILSLFVIIGLVGCGETDVVEEEAPKVEDAEVVDDTEMEEVDEAEEQEEPQGEYYFDGEVAEIRDVKIKITDTKVILAGEEGNEHGDNPVFAIWYEATNKSDKDIDSSTAWIAIFDAIQDNSEDYVNELEVGMSPDDSYSDTMFASIKKGGTLAGAIAYELDDLVTPVTLVATQGPLGDEIGRHDYDIE